MGLYDVAYGKTMPENVLQHNGISQSSCKSRGVLYNLMRVKTTLHIKMNTDVQSEQYLDFVRHDEMIKSGFIIEMNLGQENKRYATLSPNPLSPNDRDEIQNTQNSQLN